VILGSVSGREHVCFILVISCFVAFSEATDLCTEFVLFQFVKKWSINMSIRLGHSRKSGSVSPVEFQIEQIPGFSRMICLLFGPIF
jgi:hypothetical protein